VVNLTTTYTFANSSIPVLVQIPCVCIGVSLMIMVKIFYSQKTLFNQVIPICVLGMFVPIIASTNTDAYATEVIWAFILSLLFTIYIMFNIVLGLPILQQLAMTLIGLASVI
jgi:hypothetical protein